VAQTFPSKPIRIVIGFPPGGGTDIVGRLLAPKLSEALGQPVLVENRPGANGVLGMDAVAKAPADGYTIFMGTTGNLAVNPTLYPNLPFNFEKQFIALTQVVSLPFLLAVNPAVPAKNVSEFVAYAKANPGKLNYSSSGTGGLPHLAGELFNNAIGSSMVHIAYKGSAPSISDVVGGQVQFTFEATSAVLAQIKSGRLRALASTGDKRLSLLPEIPTVAETIPGFEVVNWYGMVLPAGTPREVVMRLNTEIKKVLALPEIKERLLAQGNEPVGSSPEAFAEFIKSESAKWARIIREKNIQAD
jgi:tripartite-type tricarboxylate transporter receptor subunit TctC